MKDMAVTYRLNDIVHQFLGFVYLLLGIRHDQAMQILFLVASVSGVRTALSFLDGTFATNGNLGSRLGFHFLQGVSAGSYK